MWCALSMCLRQIRGAQWASMVELAAALHVQQESAYMTIHGNTFQIGEGKKSHVIRLANDHFTLHQLHRSTMKHHSTPSMARGGVRQEAWTWEETTQEQQALPAVPDLPQRPSIRMLPSTLPCSWGLRVCVRLCL